MLEVEPSIRHDHRCPALLRMSEEVATALNERRAVVALESNVVSQGLPRPLNLITAVGVEHVVRESGAVPATTGIIAGELVIGLSQSELEQLSTSDAVAKTSSRDLAACLQHGGLGATSIAATMVIAQLAGVEVVASAGLGGVHRGAETTWDVSSDLIQLTRSRVLFVCAGAKSVLDVPKTLEYLETHCVPVFGLAVDDFPGFYTSSSGRPCPQRLDGIENVKSVWRLHTAISRGAMVVASPLPPDQALPQDVVDRAIAAALEAARKEGIDGASVTKFLTRAVDRETGGASSRANADVVTRSAAVAGRLAASLQGGCGDG